MTRQARPLTCADMVSPFLLLPHRAVLTLRGLDTIALLERLVTHATDDWTAGETRYGALLTPQGKVIADYLALRTEDGVLLDVAADHVEDLAKRLKMFRLRSQVEIDVRDDLFVFAGLDPAGDQQQTWPGVTHNYRDPRYPDGRMRVLTSDQAWTAPRDTIDAYHADRITHMVPEQGTDFGAAEVFPADINMDAMGGVALNKGCFVGQEVVSRMHRRGKIRKRTLRVSAASDAVLSKGLDITAPLPIGTITSHSGSQGLGLIRIDRLIQAEAAAETPRIGDSPVTITKPGWLSAELTTQE